MKRMTLLVLLSLYAILAVQGQAAEPSGELVLQVSSLPEAKIGYTKRFSFPFLQGESPLTQDNSINLALTAEVSPVSLNGIAEAVFTPIAFCQLILGGKIGSGWAINLFGADSYGIGLNQAAADTGFAEYKGSAFDGLLWKAHTGAALQADLAAVFPGDWNHVLVRTYHEINYKAYSKAAKHESWYFENDFGENCNGFNYYGNFLIGYQMPVFINLVALLAEADLYLYDTPDRGKWGDDKIRWYFSAIANFAVNERFGITLIAQFWTLRNYLQSNWKDLYYRNRTLDTSNPLHLEFYRAAAVLTYKL